MNNNEIKKIDDEINIQIIEIDDLSEKVSKREKGIKYSFIASAFIVVAILAMTAINKWIQFPHSFPIESLKILINGGIGAGIVSLGEVAVVKILRSDIKNKKIEIIKRDNLIKKLQYDKDRIRNNPIIVYKMEDNSRRNTVNKPQRVTITYENAKQIPNDENTSNIPTGEILINNQNQRHRRTDRY